MSLSVLYKLVVACGTHIPAKCFLILVWTMSCLLSSSIFMRAVVALTLSINRPVGVLACSGISYWFLVLFYLFLTFCESSTLFLYFHKDQSIVWFESELNFNIIIFKWIMICALLFYGLLLAIKCLGHTLTILIG